MQKKTKLKPNVLSTLIINERCWFEQFSNKWFKETCKEEFK